MIDDIQDLQVCDFIDKHNVSVFESSIGTGICNYEAEEETNVIDNKGYFDGPNFRNSNAKKEENEAVDLFQKTGDVKILEKVYENRIPTLRWWANKNKYLENNSFDDVLGELTKIFVRAIHSYKYVREKIDKDGKLKKIKTPFNTYLYTSLDNSMCNLHNRKKAKKRCTAEMENEDGSVNYMSNVLLSLNFSYSDGKDGSYTLQDILPDDKFGKDGKVVNRISFLETVSILCGKDEPNYVKEAFLKLSEGNSLASIIKEYNSKTGKIMIDDQLAEKLKINKCKNVIHDIITEKYSQKKIKLLEYKVSEGFIDYKVELNKTKESDLIIKKIRCLRKNKKNILKKIYDYN